MSLLTTLIEPVSKILDKAIPDTDLKRKLSHEISTLAEKSALEVAKGQMQANVEQAKHPSLFVAGARPSIMWICALGLLTQFFLMPIAEWITVIWYPDITLPNLNTSELTTLTLSILGLGGMRSWEKSKGVARENMKK
tara:strand:+ start:49 stop:462 length:414 start_codon:yes stop_codon:yes gene_type:complete